MPYRFKRKESIRQGVYRILDEQCRRVVEHLSAPTDRPMHVHAARQGLKRIRALLRLIRAPLPKSLFAEANDLCRDAARAVSQTRDADIILLTFDALAKDFLPLEAGAMTAVRKLLVQRCAHGPPPLPDDEVSRYFPDLLLLADRIDESRIPTRAWQTLGEGLRRCYRHGQAAMRLAYTHPSDEHFHAWRKRVKDRWHQTQLLESVWKPIMAPTADELKRLSDLLGDDHDLVVLRSLIADELKDQLGAGLKDLLLERIADRQTQLRREARRLGQCLYVEKAKRTARRLSAYWKAWKKRRRLRTPEDALDYSI